MIRPFKDSTGALEGAQESLLFSYQHDPLSGILVLILDPPDRGAGADRSFLRLHFTNVSGFHRVPGTSADLQRFTERYSARETSATTVVQQIDIEQKANSLSIALSLGSFGGLTFVCLSISAETRRARVTMTHENTWAYQDVDDGKPMDFYSPFA
ncbi:hypothetical protein [Corallococcus sp. AB011P]|uniref:hypothetical protein n=1 Tax=Corallococcus sp. AB011P TaxID=2316735 RepID=UPI0011C4687D|nr:hypothetical protein [Corallococcus sp. AB011P]